MSDEKDIKCLCEYWRCGWVGLLSEALSAPDPFNEGSTIHACPECRDQTLLTACDEAGCKSRASCGTSTPNGYRTTCYVHKPKEAS